MLTQPNSPRRAELQILRANLYLRLQQWGAAEQGFRDTQQRYMALLDQVEAITLNEKMLAALLGRTCANGGIRNVWSQGSTCHLMLSWR